ncbi:MAG: heparan-alpha-glucosaminide N-acetyltransferase, partial [Cyclobacteriaceae bacterium]
MALAYTKRLEKGLAKNEMYKKIMVRSLKIFIVGLLLNLIPAFDFYNMRIAGVLQRIAVVFFACAFLFLNLSWKIQAFLGGALLI